MSLSALPYDGSSGHSGSDTSAARARHADNGGDTRRRQARVRALLGAAGPNGMTVAEVRRVTGWHHGTASGALSNLHKVGDIARLAQKRRRNKIYVMPSDVNGRAVEPQGRRAKRAADAAYAGRDKLQAELGYVCGCGGYVVDTDGHACTVDQVATAA